MNDAADSAGTPRPAANDEASDNASGAPNLKPLRRAQPRAGLFWTRVLGGVGLLLLLVVAAMGIYDWSQNSPEKLFDEALAAVGMNNPEPAKALIARWADTPRYQDRCQLLSAALAVAEGDVITAESLITELRDNDELRVPLLTWEGRLAYRRAHYSLEDYMGFQKADECWREALRLAPEAEEPLELLKQAQEDTARIKVYAEALFAIDQGEFQTVREVYERYRAQESGRPEMNFLLGAIMRSEGRYVEALQQLSSSRTYPPLSAHSAGLAGECFVGLNRPQEALAILQQLEERYPQHVATLRLKELIAEQAPQNEESTKALSPPTP